jgi:hypothetical protein
MQMTLVPITAALTKSVAYDSQRQFLFVYPALVVFAGLGVSFVMTHCTAGKRNLFFRSSLMLVACFALVIPAVDAVRLWPYSYIYVNPLASLEGIGKSWESDYWGASSREALQFVPSGSLVARDSPYFSLVAPYLSDRQLREIPDLDDLPLGQSYYFLRNHRVGFGWTGLPSNCARVSTLQKLFRGKIIPLAYVGYCVKK